MSHGNMPLRHKPSGALRRGSSGLARLAKRDRNRCHICGLGVLPSERSRDHLVPLSQGSSSAASNLALAHRKCNSVRQSEPVDTRATPRGWRKPPKHPVKSR